MNRGKQGPECRGFRVTVSPQWRRPCGSCSGPVSPAKARGPGWSAEGVTCGDKAWEARVWRSLGGRTLALGPEWTLAPPPPPAAQPRARASLPAEAQRHPGVWRGARLPAPTPPLRGSEPAASLSQTNRGGDRVAPTRICDSSCRRPQSSQDGALGPLAWKVRAEPGTREEPPPTRQRVPGQCAARSLQAALGETLVCRVGCREEGTKGSVQGPAASVHRAWSVQALGTRTSRVL